MSKDISFEAAAAEDTTQQQPLIDDDGTTMMVDEGSSMVREDQEAEKKISSVEDESRSGPDSSKTEQRDSENVNLEVAAKTSNSTPVVDEESSMVMEVDEAEKKSLFLENEVHPDLDSSKIEQLLYSENVNLEASTPVVDNESSMVMEVDEADKIAPFVKNEVHPDLDSSKIEQLLDSENVNPETVAKTSDPNPLVDERAYAEMIGINAEKKSHCQDDEPDIDSVITEQLYPENVNPETVTTTPDPNAVIEGKTSSKDNEPGLDPDSYRTDLDTENVNLEAATTSSDPPKVSSELEALQREPSKEAILRGTDIDSSGSVVIPGKKRIKKNSPRHGHGGTLDLDTLDETIPMPSLEQGSIIGEEGCYKKEDAQYTSNNQSEIDDDNDDFSEGDDSACNPKKRKRGEAIDFKSPSQRRISQGKRSIPFEERLEELKEFKRINGHCRVGQRNPDFLQLGKFVKKIREYKKRMDQDKYTGSVITPGRVMELEALGFEWVSKEAKMKKSFDERIEDLQEFKTKFGHCNVPRIYDSDPSLASWCHCLRISFRQINEGNKKPMKKLTSNQITLLQDLGFEWTRLQNPREKSEQKSFEQRIEELKVFKTQNGNLRVTERKDKNLAHFCNHMRTAHRNRGQKNGMSITDDRIKALDDIGFEWAPSTQRPGTSVEERIDQLKVFKEKHSHLRVTASLDKSLATFCANMRSARNNPAKARMVVTKERINALDDIGFEWTAELQKQQQRQRVSFEDRIEHLKEFKGKNGHIRVTASMDRSLASFCTNMRTARTNPTKTNMTVTDERIKALDDIGFEWTAEQQRQRVSFEDRIQQLKDFKAKHGNLHVTASLDKSLASFCSNTRSSRNNPDKSTILVTEERIKALDDIGFEWTAEQQQRQRVSFDNRIQQLKEFKETHGHLHVTASLDKSLATFCTNMRSARTNPGKVRLLVTDDRIKALDDIGFEWTVEKQRNRVSFEDRILQLKDFKEEHGHLRVTASLDKSLASFCTNIRSSRNNPGKSTIVVTDERIKALDNIDFEWSPEQKKPRISFEERIEQLKEFKGKNGHLRVTASLDRSLASFCTNIRSSRNNPDRSTILVTDERIKALDDLGFEWSKEQQRQRVSFEDRIQQLTAFKERHGHVHVTASLDKNLAAFCTNMRQARNNPGKARLVVTEERIKLLSDLGFGWTIDQPQRQRVQFEERIEQLKAFKEKNGHLRVTASLDKSLASFCTNVRSSRNNPGGKSTIVVTDERIKALDDIGFAWTQSALTSPTKKADVEEKEIKSTIDEHEVDGSEVVPGSEGVEVGQSTTV